MNFPLFLGAPEILYSSPSLAASAVQAAEILGADLLVLRDAYASVAEEKEACAFYRSVFQYRCALLQKKPFFANEAKEAIVHLIADTPDNKWLKVLGVVKRNSSGMMHEGFLTTPPLSDQKIGELLQDRGWVRPPSYVASHPERLALHQALFTHGGLFSNEDVTAFYRQEKNLIEVSSDIYLKCAKALLAFWQKAEVSEGFREEARVVFKKMVRNKIPHSYFQNWTAALEQAWEIRKEYPKISGPGLLELALEDILQMGAVPYGINMALPSKRLVWMQAIGFDTVHALDRRTTVLKKGNRVAVHLYLSVDSNWQVRTFEQKLDLLEQQCRSSTLEMWKNFADPLFIEIDGMGANPDEIDIIRRRIEAVFGKLEIRLRFLKQEISIHPATHRWSTHAWFSQKTPRNATKISKTDPVTGVTYHPFVEITSGTLFYQSAYYSSGEIYLDEQMLLRFAEYRHLSERDVTSLAALLLVHEKTEQEETERAILEVREKYLKRWHDFWEQTDFEKRLDPFVAFDLAWLMQNELAEREYFLETDGHFSSRSHRRAEGKEAEALPGIVSTIYGLTDTVQIEERGQRIKTLFQAFLRYASE